MEARTLDGIATAEEGGTLLGAEHDALVGEIDLHLSCGRAEDAAPLMARLRVRFPDSPHATRLRERLRIVESANAHWRTHGESQDFLTLFSQAGRGASSAGVGVVLTAVGLLFTFVGLSDLLFGQTGSGLVHLIIGGPLLWLACRLFSRGREA
jgi:hypothetical protein